MRDRTRLGITAAIFCHLLLAHGLVTSQLLPPGQVAQKEIPAQQPPSGPAADTRPGEPVTIRAREQEKDGDIFKLRGDVEIEFRDLLLRADEITYNARTGDVTATGHMVVSGGPRGEHIEASRGTYNVRTETGNFHDVVATTGARFRGRDVTLTTSSPFAFTGRVVEKTGPNRYVVHNGSVTSCELPNPKWSFHAGRVVVEVGDEAKIYHSTFRIKGVPVFYFPYAQHPVDALARKSGFLVPTFGTSSRKGTIIGESFYWAINRSMDLTLGAQYFSRRGFAQDAEFRLRPAENAFLGATYFGVLDRGFDTGTGHVDQGGQDIHLDGEAQLKHGIRGVASVNYLSSFVFRLAFTEGFSQTVNSEVKSLVFLSKTFRGFSFNSLAARYQNFQSTTRGDVVTILHAPSAEVSSVDQQVGRWPLYWSFNAAIEGVSRKQPNFITDNLVGRFDLHPRATLALLVGGWTIRPEIALRNTYYTQRLLPDGGGVGVPGSDNVNRRALDLALELRPPALARIFERPVFGRKVKHAIEPRVVYRHVNGVDSFRTILRFDSRDILSNTTEVEYAVMQRLYIKRAGEESETRELVSWELKQKYFFDDDFGGAVVNGKRNVFTTTDQFAGIAFLTEPRRFSPLVSRIRIHPSASTDMGWQLDYDFRHGRVNASTTFVNWHLGDFILGGSHAFLLAPGEIFVSNPIPGPDRFNQFRVLIGYGNPAKRGWSTAANIGFDANLNFLQYSAFQASHNWDCCGLSFEYRRYALGPVRNENQFRFAFTLANIGTFGNLKRQERIF